MALVEKTVAVPIVAAPTVAPHAMRPVVATEPVSEDADDPAIWIHPTDPARSLILGTDKTKAPGGGLYVFGLDGKVRQHIAGLDRPNNVDVEYGLLLNGERIDIAVVTERLQRRLRVFRIARTDGKLTDLAPDGLPIFVGEEGENAAPMGISLYKRPRDGAVFAVVGRKSGPRGGYLWQYRLQDDGAGKLAATKVRAFGSFSGQGEIEAIAVDDALGAVFYADEGDGIHKWHADPDDADATREMAHFGREGFGGDREGIAIYTQPDGSGFVVCTDQLKDDSAYHVFRRGKEAPEYSQPVAVARGGADETDGIEATSTPLGAQFPNGLLVVMNSKGRNFLLYRWEDVVGAR